LALPFVFGGLIGALVVRQSIKLEKAEAAKRAVRNRHR
jgi:hypothetical protein